MVKWTPGSVREQLPDVTVKDALGHVRTGWLRGRKERFALVLWNAPDGTEQWATWNWDAIARALNNRRPLRV